jgi:hypothetical protein
MQRPSSKIFKVVCAIPHPLRPVITRVPMLDMPAAQWLSAMLREVASQEPFFVFLATKDER